MDLLVFLVPIVTGLVWAGSGVYYLMTDNELRRSGIRTEARVVGPVPGVTASHSRSKGNWVLNPLLSFTTPDGRTVEQGVGSKKRAVRVRANTQVTVFHSPDDPTNSPSTATASADAPKPTSCWEPPWPSYAYGASLVGRVLS